MTALFLLILIWIFICLILHFRKHFDDRKREIFFRAKIWKIYRFISVGVTRNTCV